MFNKEQCQKNLNKLVPNANLTLWFPNKDLINQGKLKCIASLKHGKTNVFNLVLLMILLSLEQVLHAKIYIFVSVF